MSRVPFLPILVVGLGATLVIFWVWWNSAPPAETLVPKLRLVFEIEPGESIALREFMAEFARREGFEIYDSLDLIDPEIRNSYIVIDLVRDDDMMIGVTDFLTETQFFVFFYEKQPTADFWEVTSLFANELFARWPNLVPYTGP